MSQISKKLGNCSGKQTAVPRVKVLTNVVDGDSALFLRSRSEE